jgi:hypothetical protein
MTARKLAIVGLLAAALLTSFTAPRNAQAGGARPGTRGAYYRVTMYWVHRQTRQTHSTAMTVRYYWNSGVDRSDWQSLTNHVRYKNQLGWYCYNYRYEHPRYFQ